MLIVEKHIVLQPAGGHPRDERQSRLKIFFLAKADRSILLFLLKSVDVWGLEQTACDNLYI